MTAFSRDSQRIGTSGADIARMRLVLGELHASARDIRTVLEQLRDTAVRATRYANRVGDDGGAQIAGKILDGVKNSIEALTLALIATSDLPTPLRRRRNFPGQSRDE